jgi:peptidoglycan/xylan/chitin deacetylase (PgdA/CDA1 family)
MRPVILMYHRVSELRPDTHSLCVSPARFRAEMRQLVEARRPMPLAELAESRDPRGVAVTLDDGTLDALTAMEILDDLGVPATFFIGGDRLDEPHESWWDTLERIFLGGAPLPESYRGLSTSNPHDRASAHQGLRARLLVCGASEQAELLADLAEWCGLDLSPRPSHRLLLAPELVRLRHHAIGAHGLRHLHLPSLAPEDRRLELSQSRAALETCLGRSVTLLAYAYGACDDAVVAQAAELGFTCGVTVEDRAVTETDHRLRLPRRRGLQ